MKKQIRSVLLAAAGLAVVTSAQAATYNGDLLVGFTSGTGNDLVYDLGSFASLVNGEQWHLGATGLNLLSAYNLNTVQWGVVGNNLLNLNNRTLYTTFGSTPVSLNGSQGNAVNGNVGAIYGSFGTAGAGQSASIPSGNANSWATETTSVAPGNTYINNFENPNTTGLSSITFWTEHVNQSAVQGLDFSLDSTGTLTYGTVAVPEPTTYGLIAGAGLLAVSFRNQFRRKQA